MLHLGCRAEAFACFCQQALTIAAATAFVSAFSNIQWLHRLSYCCSMREINRSSIVRSIADQANELAASRIQKCGRRILLSDSVPVMQCCTQLSY